MIAGVLLAAGGSRRMGRSKQLLRFRGSSLVRRAAQAALDGGCDPLVVVLGAAAGRVRNELSGLAVELVVNEDWPDGIAGSIRRGIAKLDEDPRPIRAAILIVCDQPLLDAGVIRRLVSVFDGSQGSRVACEYGDTIGVPALFERSLFPQLMRLAGDHGAKQLLLQHPEGTRRVPWSEGVTEVDRPEDLAMLE
jgi:molybdenum cofactor cytidylyltransferase